MAVVTLTWGAGVQELSMIGASALDYLDGPGFYAILGANRDVSGTFLVEMKVLYIGHAFGESLREEISRENAENGRIAEFLNQNPGYEPVVMVGAVTHSDDSVDRGLFQDIQCCLVHANQPSYNDGCRDAYTGRDIEIINTGDFYPIEEQSVASA